MIHWKTLSRSPLTKDSCHYYFHSQWISLQIFYSKQNINLDCFLILPTLSNLTPFSQGFFIQFSASCSLSQSMKLLFRWICLGCRMGFAFASRLPNQSTLSALFSCWIQIRCDFEGRISFFGAHILRLHFLFANFVVFHLTFCFVFVSPFLLVRVQACFLLHDLITIERVKLLLFRFREFLDKTFILWLLLLIK